MTNLRRQSGATGAGFAAPVASHRTIFGAARYIPGLNRVRLFDTRAQSLAANGVVNIPIGAANGVPVAAGQPVAVVVMRAATPAKNTSDGTLSVVTVHANATTTALGLTSALGGSSALNFHGELYTGLIQAGDTAIRITSATADATTVIIYRACIWSKITGAATYVNASTNGAHPPVTKGPLGTAVAGGIAFFFGHTYSGGSAAKTVSWNTPSAGPVLPGEPWLSNVFTVAAQQFPMVCTIGRAAPAKTFTLTGTGGDWADAILAESLQNWGE